VSGSFSLYLTSVGHPEISPEDRAILAFAGFVSFISLLAGVPFGM
jgi:hypothetical protein